MSSRRRLYLDLKAGIVKLFKTPAHYLKEIVSKQSIFEKPYFDGDYRKMHLDLPVPRWSWPEFDPTPGGIWPKHKKHTFVFDDGICSVFGRTGECGELVTISGWIGLSPLHAGGMAIAWEAISSDPELAEVVTVEPSLGGISVSISVQLSDTLTGTAVICITATSAGGSFLKEIAFRVPESIGGVRVTPGWTPNLDYAMRNLPAMYETRQQPSWDCGCVSLEVTCCDDSGIAWDSDVSAETVARENSCTIAITDSLGAGGPYTWSVVGTGFTVSSSTTRGLSNILIADDTACGPAVITVTGCDGATVTGYVRCTTGQWIVDQTYPTAGDPSIPDCWCSSGGPLVYFNPTHRVDTNHLDGGTGIEGPGECLDGVSTNVNYTYNIDGFQCTQKEIFTLVFTASPDLCNIVGSWAAANLEYWGC